MILLLDSFTCLLRGPISLELFRLRYFERAPSAPGDMPDKRQRLIPQPPLF